MPVIKKPLPSESAQHKKLVNKLADELMAETATGPQIIEAEQHGGYLQVTVLWDEWRDIDPTERGRIIMDAYAMRRTSDLGKISLALGLTVAEASKLGISTTSV